MKGGFFVTFEGGEGSGKSSLMDRCGRELENRGFDILTTREPGATSLGEEVRRLVLKKNERITIGPRAELLLYLVARAQNLQENIIPALEAGKVVLCDRYHDSTISYQGYGRGQDVLEVENLCHLACWGVQPQLTFFLDVDPEIGIKRSQRLAKDVAAAGERDRIEGEELAFHDRVREGMHQLAARDVLRICTLDAHKSEDEVFSEALKILMERTKRTRT